MGGRLYFLGWGPVLMTPVWRADLRPTVAWSSSPGLASTCQLFLGKGGPHFSGSLADGLCRSFWKPLLPLPLQELEGPPFSACHSHEFWPRGSLRVSWAGHRTRVRPGTDLGGWCWGVSWTGSPKDFLLTTMYRGAGRAWCRETRNLCAQGRGSALGASSGL